MAPSFLPPVGTMAFATRARYLAALFWSLAMLTPLIAGQTQKPEPEPSHQERFAGPQAVLQKKEDDATARLQSHPQDAAALNDRGLARMALGKPDSAIADFRQGIALDPKSADLRANLAYALFAQGRLDEAMAAARQCLELDAGHAAAHYYMARILLATGGDLQDAIQHLEKAADRNPEDLNILFDLFNAYRQAQDFVHASLELRLLRAALPPNHASIFYSEGLVQADLGNLRAAIAKFQRALALDPKLDRVRQDLGVALVKTGDYKAAAEALQPLAERQPQSFPAAYFHALALQNSERSAEAEAEARRATTIRPDSADAHALLGIILAGRGAYEPALASLARAIELDPRNFDAQLYLGRARYAMRDLPGATQALRSAVELKPEDPEARFFLATILEAAGDKDAATAEYRNLVASRPQDARGYLGLGALLAKYGQAQDGIAQLRRARELDPENFETNMVLGRELARQGKLEEALTLLRQAAELAPEMPEPHYQLGMALRRAGKAQEAAQEFATVDRLNRSRRTGGMDGNGRD